MDEWLKAFVLGFCFGWMVATSGSRSRAREEVVSDWSHELRRFDDRVTRLVKRGFKADDFRSSLRHEAAWRYSLLGLAAVLVYMAWKWMEVRG